MRTVQLSTACFSALYMRANALMKGVLTLLLLTWAPAATAQNLWPALFDVTGVSSDDVLNVRATADAGATIIGSLPHDQTNVEIAFDSDDGKWGAVNVGERSGWVRLSFLKRQSENWTDARIPFGICFGTEPFWSLRPKADTFDDLILQTPEATYFPNLVTRIKSLNRTDRIALAAGQRSASGFQDFALLSSSTCSDGMSDRVFGIEINIFHNGQLLSGCCSLTNPSN